MEIGRLEAASGRPRLNRYRSAHGTTIFVRLARVDGTTIFLFLSIDLFILALNLADTSCSSFPQNTSYGLRRQERLSCNEMESRHVGTTKGLYITFLNVICPYSLRKLGTLEVRLLYYNLAIVWGSFVTIN